MLLCVACDASDQSKTAGTPHDIAAPRERAGIAADQGLLADRLPLDPSFYDRHGVTRADEATAYRAASAYAFSKPDGSLAMVLLPGVVNYRDARGRYRPIDTTIVEWTGDPQGSAPKPAARTLTGAAPAGFANRTNSLRTHFPETAARGVLVAAATASVRWVPTRRAIVNGQTQRDILEVATGVAGVATGDVVRYAGTYPDVAEEYVVRPGLVKHDIVLASPPDTGTAGALEFQGRLELSPGLTLYVRGEQQLGDFTTTEPIELRDRHGATVLRLARPRAYELDHSRVTTPVEYRVRRRHDGAVILSLATPAAWLLAPERRYPVVIDPDVLGPDGDYSMDTGGGTKFDSDNEDVVGQLGANQFRTSIRFPISVVPSTATITNVDLQLTVTSATSDTSRIGRVITDPQTANPTAYDEAGGVGCPGCTQYVASSSILAATGVRSQGLGATALTQLDTAITAGDPWFAVGLRRSSESGGGNSVFASAADPIVASRPELVITMTLPAPEAFSLVTPPNGSVDRSTVGPLTWQKSESATSYRIVISTNSDLTMPTVDDVLDIGAVPEPTRYDFDPPLAENTTYYWRITAQNGTGTRDDAEGIWSFTTGTNPVWVWRGDIADWDPTKYATIQAAVDSIGGVNVSGWSADADNNAVVVEVRDSAIHNESVLIDASKVAGTSTTRRFTLRAKSGHSPILDYDGGDVFYVVYVNGVDAVVIDGFEIRHATPDSMFVGINLSVDSSDDFIVRNCDIHSSSDDGIFTDIGGSNQLIENSNVHDNGRSGITVNAGSAAVVRGNRVARNGFRGVNIQSNGASFQNNVVYEHLRGELINVFVSATGVTIGNNTLFDSTDGLFIQGTVTGTHNIFHSHISDGVETNGAGASASLDYNVWFNNANDVNGPGKGGNAVNADPLLADPAGEDFHLQSSFGTWNTATSSWDIYGADSPAIDAGNTGDPFADEPSPNGGRINIGAYGNTVEASLSGAAPAPTPGDIIFVEIMRDPAAVADIDGEWIELKNLTGAAVDLQGCILKDGTADSHTIAAGPVLVTAGGVIVLGRDTSSAVNGGATVHYSYADQFALTNTTDELILECSATEIDRVDYIDSWFPSGEGFSLQLDPGSETATANDSISNWCNSVNAFGDGDIGTPGAANPECSAPAPGEVIITEILRDPAVVTDADGEWFEVKNVSGATVDLQGCVLRDDDVNRAVINNSGPLAVGPGQWLLLASNASSATNGGTFPDYAYGPGTDFDLGNTTDEIVVECGGAQIDRVGYTAAWFPNDPGPARQLDPGSETAAANDMAANWCDATTPFGAGDLGTPGTANNTCTCPDSDLDGFADAACGGPDCDDGNNMIFPGSPCGDASDTDCTNPDICDLGGSGACEPNHEAPGTACGDQGVDCLIDDACDGAGGCVDNGFGLAGTACGDPADSECSNPDRCDGVGGCDANHEVAGFSCGDTGLECLIDDRCDGGGTCTDGGFDDGAMRPCGTNVGACALGVEACSGGVFGACIGGIDPAVEVCDGLDNNCDGTADEGLGAGSCVCGDGFVSGGLGEECDDGGDPPADGDGCAADCTVEDGWDCADQPSVCTPICGDGVVRGDEECDDGVDPPAGGDGCAADCTVEDGWTCNPDTEPTQCVELEECGDGNVVGGEQCDDGNLVDADGCNAMCLVEDGCSCDDEEPSGCTCADGDGDGVNDVVDNCPDDANPDQEDLDGDGDGDVCDEDADGDGLNDDIDVGGGGCCDTSSGGGGGAPALAVLVLWLLVRRRRSAAWLLIFAISVPAGTASADPEDWDAFPVDRFRLAMDGEGMLNVDWAGVPEHRAWNAVIWFETSNDPLVLVDAGDERVGALVAQRFATGLGGTIALWDRVQLGLSTRIVVFQNNNNPEELFSMEPVALATSGLGDLRVSPKLGVLGGPNARFHLALIPAFTVPLGSEGDYLRERRATIAPELAVSGSFGAVRVSGNAGYQWRKRARIANLVVDDELLVRAGVGWRLGTALAPTGELVLSLSASTGTASGTNDTSYELLLGGKKAFGSVHLFGAAGVGLGQGFGTPDWRVLAGTRMQFRNHDRDRDGIKDRVDRCPFLAEDIDSFEDADGCPDLDNDGDGIVDAVDKAPDTPEDMDGFEDSDGAPDLDNDGDGIADAEDKCPDKAETNNGHEDDDGCPDDNLVRMTATVVDETGAPVAGAQVSAAGQTGQTNATGAVTLGFDEPAQVEVTVAAGGFKPHISTATLTHSAEPIEVTVRLEKLPPPGTIRGVIRSYKGAPLSASILVEPIDIKTSTDEDGFFEIELPTGDYEIVVQAQGYRSQRRKVRVDENGVTVLNADLRRGRNRRSKRR